MQEIYEKNMRKMPKVIYLLLEKWHRRIGLAVIGWWKEPDNLYFSFYSLASRTKPDEPVHFIDIEGDLKLTTYQSHYGFPGWSAGEQKELEDQGEKVYRSAELLRYLEDNLTLRMLERDKLQQILAWQQRYSVDEAERYLFSWNVLGHLSTETRNSILTYGVSELGEDKLMPYHRHLRLGWPRVTEELHVCGRFAVCNNGRVLLPNDNVIDAYEKARKDNITARHMAKDIINYKS